MKNLGRPICWRTIGCPRCCHVAHDKWARSHDVGSTSPWFMSYDLHWSIHMKHRVTPRFAECYEWLQSSDFINENNGRAVVTWVLSRSGWPKSTWSTHVVTCVRSNAPWCATWPAKRMKIFKNWILLRRAFSVQGANPIIFSQRLVINLPQSMRNWV